MHRNLLYTLICIFCLVGCTNETKVQSVRLNPTEMTLGIGETRQIEMLIEPISAIIYNPTSWHSSDPNVAQVDAKGNVTAIYAGECLITGKTKNHEGYCRVNVVAPEYDLTFTKSILFDEGIDEDSNLRNLILRLYDDDLTIDSTGAMSGNGIFLNINLYAPIDSKELPAGKYLTSDTISDFTILAGALRQEGDSYYATGSYLGQYTDNGLSALFLTEGSITIENSGSHTIKCSFSGVQGETVDATFDGAIVIYDTSKENETITIEYTNSGTEEIDLESESTLNHIKITASNADTTVTFVARIPKSIDYLPEGNYHLSSDVKAYTLVGELCTIASHEATTNITSATLLVKENDFQATFTSANGVKYLLQPTNKSENIRKQEVKTFVY